MHVSNFTAQKFAPYGFHGILTAVATSGIIFSLLGFRQAVELSAEAKNPGHDVPRAIVIELLIVAAIDILVPVVFIGAIPAHSLSGGWAKVSFQGPFVDLSLMLGLTWLAWFMRISAVLSPLGAGWVYFASTARAVLGFANNGYFVEMFTRVDEKTGIPRAAMWLSLILGLIWTGPFPAWNKLVAFASGASVLTYVVGPVSAMVFRRHAIHAKRPVRLAGIPVIALIAFVVGSNIVYWTGWSNVEPLMILGFGALAIFLGFSIVVRRLQNQLSTHLHSSLWILVYVIFMLVVSHFGSFGGTKQLVYPYDILTVILGSAFFFFWGIVSGRGTPSLDRAILEAEHHHGENEPDTAAKNQA